jgi:hypothetical protein
MGHYNSPNRHVFVEGLAYVVTKDRCVMPVETPRLSVAQLLRRFFAHVQTVARPLCTGVRRLHYYFRPTRVRLDGRPGSKEFAESYLRAIQSLPIVPTLYEWSEIKAELK